MKNITFNKAVSALLLIICIVLLLQFLLSPRGPRTPVPDANQTQQQLNQQQNNFVDIDARSKEEFEAYRQQLNEQLPGLGDRVQPSGAQLREWGTEADFEQRFELDKQNATTDTPTYGP